ncbi:MAG: ParB N-terminal domain-containing protein [Dehalococcoidia bacterium]
MQPMLARREDNSVVGGHQRLLAARRLGSPHVPVIYLDLTHEQARVLNLALNRISGTWDEELLARMVADLSTIESVDLTISGFSEDELDKLLRSLDVREKKEQVEAFDLDQALDAARSAPRAQRGELWAMGDHRLLIGDSTDTGAVERLFDGAKASLMATDPPYLVDYQGGNHPQSKTNSRKTKDKHWDDYTDPEAAVEFFTKFLKAALPHLVPNAAIYQWHAPQAGARRGSLEAGGAARAPADNLGEGTRRADAQPLPLAARACFYGWVEGKKPKRRSLAPARSPTWRRRRPSC